MVRVALELEGADRVRRAFATAAEDLGRPLPPLLRSLAGHWALTFQRYVSNGGPPGVRWPDWHPATFRIRRHYGHDLKRRLIRNGNLRDSLRTLSLGGDSAVVGTTVPHARTVNDGGVVTEDGRRRTVQAFPFVEVTDELVEESLDLVEDYLLQAFPSEGS